MKTRRAMLRRIKVEQLKPGMYVENLDRSWRAVPVFRHRITSHKQVDQLVRYRVHEVVINTDKGIDLPGAPPPSGATPGDSAAGGGAASAPGTDPVPYHEEIAAANTVYEQALVSVSRLMDAVRQGERPDLALAESTVDDMIGSLLRNRDALSSLINLKMQSEAVFQHSIRVCILSMVFATRLAFTRYELKALGMGALLHDSGKMRLAPELVDKAQPLDSEEFTQYRQHPLLGAKLFNASAGIEKQSLLILLQHHERADGSGFPQGLSGAEISRGAKMVTIVDTFDNLTARAIPERRQTPHDALHWIRDWGGQGFEPKLIDEFISALGLHPVGSFIRLSDNRLAIVMSVHHNPAMLPKVWVVFDANHKQLPEPALIDLAEQHTAHPLTIVAALLPEKFGFDLPGFVKARGLLTARIAGGNAERGRA